MLDANDLWSIEQDLEKITGGFPPVTLVYPLSEQACPDCGFDEYTQSAIDPACGTCYGIGKVFEWAAVECTARIQPVDFAKLAFAGVTPGTQVGETLVYLPSDMVQAVQKVQSSQYGYILVDGETHRPVSVQNTGVGMATEVRLELKRVTVDARADGY